VNAIDPASLPLRDIHLPAAISWWPPAPGWWLLAIALTLGPLSVGLWWRWRQRTRLRRDLLPVAQVAGLVVSHNRLGRDALLRVR
jgi:hypothetical protein